MDYSEAIATLKQADPILAALIERLGDCTLSQTLSTGTLLEALSESIVYQQLSGKAAATIHRRFLALYADAPELTPALILATPDEDLRAAGLSRAKARYVKDLAQKISDGLPSVAELEPLDDESIIKIVTQVNGIGRWTAEMLLIFRLHRWDVLPLHDLGIRAAIRQAYRLEELPDARTLQALGERWRPYRTIAAWYLWRSLEP